MRATLKMIATLGGAGVLFGCASNQTAMEMKIVPSMQVKHSSESGGSYYSLGRYFHGARRWPEAQKAYQQALILEPGHADAGNALAVLYAERGEYEKALTILQKLANARPDASHLFSNLGHTYYLSGDYEMALVSLEKATALDSKNSRAWRNLGNVLEKLGKTERASIAFAQAGMIAAGSAQQGPVHVALMQASSPPNPSTPAVANRTASETGDVKPAANHNAALPNRQEKEAKTEIKRAGPGVYELRQVGSMATITEAAVSTAALTHPARATVSVASTISGIEGEAPDHVSKQKIARLEIINGNGIRGMAKSIGRIIDKPEMRVVRLANQKPFDVKATRIEYSKGYEQAAHSLAQELGQFVRILPDNAGSFSNIRLVLGKDMQDVNAFHQHHRKHFEVAGKSGSE